MFLFRGRKAGNGEPGQTGTSTEQPGARDDPTMPMPRVGTRQGNKKVLVLATVAGLVLITAPLAVAVWARGWLSETPPSASPPSVPSPVSAPISTTTTTSSTPPAPPPPLPAATPVSVPRPAPQAPPPAPLLGIMLKNVVTQKCLHDSGGDPGLNVSSQPCDPLDPHQRWQRQNTGSTVVYANIGTGQCLDNDGNYSYTKHCNGGKYQVWQNGAAAGNAHSLDNPQTGKCVNDDGTNVQMGQCQAGDGNQRWLESAAVAQPAGIMMKSVATGKCLNDAFGDPASLSASSCDPGSAQQRWQLEGSIPAGTYVNVGTGECLDGNGQTNYSSGCNNGTYQVWLGQAAGGNAYSFQSKQTGTCLDTDGTNVFPASCGNQSQLLWTLIGNTG